MYNTRFYDRFGTAEEVVKALLINYIISNGNGYIWNESKNRWIRVSINHIKSKIREITWKYFRFYATKKLPKYDDIYKLITNDNIIFNNEEHNYIDGNNVIYDSERGEHRNIIKEDYIVF